MTEEFTPKERRVIETFIVKANRSHCPEAEAHLRRTLENNMRSAHTGWREIVADMREEEIK